MEFTLNGKRKTTKKTRVIKATLNPEWNEVIEFQPKDAEQVNFPNPRIKEENTC